MKLLNTAIEHQCFREALGHYASGITVISSHCKGDPIGFTCQSFYSVSMNPPLVSFCVKASSFSYPKIRDAGSFVVNILSGEQVHVSDQFAQQGTDKWQGIEWQESPLGNPVLAGNLCCLDCEIYATYPAGDHVIVIGEVKALSAPKLLSSQALVYFKGQYCKLVADAIISSPIKGLAAKPL